jgi:ABC-type Fe3+ transport system permease subunit
VLPVPQPAGGRAGGHAAFQQLDRSLDEASLMLRASTSRTLATWCCRC